MARAAGVCWTLLMGCVFAAHAVTFEVTDGNSTCIKGELNASFSISYNTTNGTSVSVFALPASASVSERSSCGSAAVPPELALVFGDTHTHTLSLLFSRDQRLYRVSNISLQYNLSDGDIFPQSSSAGVQSVMASVSELMSARLNSTYRCVSSSSISLSAAVNLTLSGVQMEAYMSSANLSADESVCSADQPSTTVAPPPSTTTSPPPIPPVPERGNYSVTDGNGTVCVLALMGLQLNITHTTTQNQSVSELMNLQPNQTTVSGSCGVTESSLRLSDETTNLTFSFTMNSTTQKYYLSAVSVSALWPDMSVVFEAGNTSLSALQCSVGRSYVCSAQQMLSVTPVFSINTFRLQLQPFNITANRFSTAEECRVDQENMLIPIIVGAALAGLVLIVLVAYLIGRKRTHAGYQTI
ncbi:lysosome-associated membrane glycoprotein 1a precursor [Danio rerio]|uniref:Lysosome-associated membrane glycoprotein 1 n=2 Tax=Danio rerio TaxID=7955 RepID=Q6P299_DANRE|nr:lysosome-associated membrane glycoprotein 1a precursor [Danio rerio]AAH64667.1 Zgc:64072 [Danio rerio]|eukprot:NP_955996.1 lysosome-associated membrane glycoprotein 1 precursor [Danio rerio]